MFKDMRNCLIACQGPSQALSAIDALYYYTNGDMHQIAQSCVVLGGMNSPNLQAINSACVDIFKAWGITKIIDATDLQEYERSYEIYTPCLMKKLPENSDILFQTRSRQPFNIALRKILPDSKKICIGDGSGIFTEIDRKSSDYFDCWISYFALFYNMKIKKPLILIPLEQKKHVLEESSSRIEVVSDACSAIKEMCVQPCSVLMMTNLTEKKYTESLKHEIDFYKQMLVKSDSGEHILIKSHPRDSDQKAKVLKLSLEREGYNVTLLDDKLLYFPLELLLPQLPQVKKVYTGLSSSVMPSILVRPDINFQIGFPAHAYNYINPKYWLPFNANLCNFLKVTKQIQHGKIEPFESWDYENETRFVKAAASFPIEFQILKK